MKNLRISLKLIISFLIVIVLSVVVGGVGIVGMFQINSADDVMYNSNLMAITYIGKIRTEYNIQRASIRDLALYHSEDENFRSAISEISRSETAMDELIKLYNSTIEDDEDQALFDSFTNAYTVDFAAVKRDVTAYGENDDSEGAQEVLRTQGASSQAIIGPALSSCMEFNEKIGKISVDNNTVLFTTMTIIEVVVLVISVAVAMFLALYISGLISKPVTFMKNVLYEMGARGRVIFSADEYRQAGVFAEAKDEVGESIQMLINTGRRLEDVGKALETVASGDLTAELALLSEADTIGISLEKMQESLNSMFGEINAATAQVATGSKQIADGSQSLAQGSTEQAAAVEQLSSSISEIAQKTKENAAMAGKAADLANSIMGNAEKGSRQMNEMMVAVKEINDASQSISKVIGVIDNIAFQTNILALNAAVEAARAGQHGKGFAVVAEEVRSLASKSADAAKETSDMIANSMEKAALGARIAEETAVSLNDIVTGINESTQLVGEIAHSSEEQSLGITQINKGIDQVAQVVQQNSATAEESAAASEEMSGQSNMLQDLVAQFKIKENNTFGSLTSGSSAKRLAAPDKASYATEKADGDFGKY